MPPNMPAATAEPSPESDALVRLCLVDSSSSARPVVNSPVSSPPSSASRSDSAGAHVPV